MSFFAPGAWAALYAYTPESYPIWRFPSAQLGPGARGVPITDRYRG